MSVLLSARGRAVDIGTAGAGHTRGERAQRAALRHRAGRRSPSLRRRARRPRPHREERRSSSPTPFLDIQARIATAGEGGLLGLAFPPDYATSGLFYVYYTDLANDSVVSRFLVTGNPNVADPNSEEMLLFVDQPTAGLTNHKGGTIHFGPDGFLWFATGDGGGANDPAENAQNPQSLLGKMLRIDSGPTSRPARSP